MYRSLIFAVQKYTNSAREVEESVMGRIAWEAFNDIKYKDMTGPRKPTRRKASEKHKAARNNRLEVP